MLLPTSQDRRGWSMGPFVRSSRRAWPPGVFDMTRSGESAADAAMPAAKWPSVTPAALDELAKGRAEAINIVQWLARIADSFVVAGSTEERIALDFRRDDLALVTRTFENGLALELRLPML